MPTTKGHGKYIETPEKLWELFSEFMEWIKNNPFQVQDYVGKDGLMVYRDKQRPLTWMGFEKWLYLNSIISDMRSYEQNEKGSYTNYLPVISRIKAICKGDIVEGSSSGIFNANIASRVAELTDKQETKLTGTPFVLTLTEPHEADGEAN